MGRTRVKFRIKGVRQVKRAIREIEREAPAAFGRALVREAQGIMSASARRVPVDQGDLKRSQFVDRPRVTRRGASVEMGYKAKHAAVVHETHEGGGRGFLSVPVRQARKGFEERVARDVGRDLLGSGGGSGGLGLGGLIIAGKRVMRSADTALGSDG